jgi:hypothetical protein
MKKQTMPNEPDEMPVPKEAPEIRQPNDPQEPKIPVEDPERIPQEIPPEPPNFPEIRPGGQNNQAL